MLLYKERLWYTMGTLILFQNITVTEHPFQDTCFECESKTGLVYILVNFQDK